MTTAKTATTILLKPLFATMRNPLTGMDIETVTLQPGALIRNVYTREKDSGPVTTFEVFDGDSSWYRYRTLESVAGDVLGLYAPRGRELLHDGKLPPISVAKDLVQS